MLRQLLTVLFAALTVAAHAAVDINKASQAELEAVKGIGPSMSERILVERQKAEFKDWNDVIVRVKGVGEGNAAKFSAAGLTVGGSVYATSAAAPADKPAAKPAAKSPAKPETRQ
jgi:competence protein ComEA